MGGQGPAQQVCVPPTFDIRNACTSTVPLELTALDGVCYGVLDSLIVDLCISLIVSCSVLYGGRWTGCRR